MKYVSALRLGCLLIPATVIFIVLSHFGLLPTRLWYSALTQRPRLANIAQKMGLQREQLLGVVSRYGGWGSRSVSEEAIYLVPRTTDITQLGNKARAAIDGLNSDFSTTTDFSSLMHVINIQQLKFTETPRVPPTKKLELFIETARYSSVGGVGVMIYDPQAVSPQYVVDGKNIDDYYVVLIAAREPQFGIPY